LVLRLTSDNISFTRPAIVNRFPTPVLGNDFDTLSRSLVWASDFAQLVKFSQRERSLQPKAIIRPTYKNTSAQDNITSDGIRTVRKNLFLEFL